MNLRVETIKPRSRSEIQNGRLCGFLELSIKVASGLHVGMGGFSFKIEKNVLNELSKIDLREEKELNRLAGKIFSDYAPFAHYRDGRVVIPASSVKGNVRSRLELSFRGRNGTVRACFTATTRRGGRGSWRHKKLWETYTEVREVPVGREVWGERQCRFDPERNPECCLLCDLFGTVGLASLVRFSDFVGENINLQERNFEYNVKLTIAPEGSIFRGKVSFFNLEKYELGLLLLGMGIESGTTGREVLMGRLKYRGEIGKVRYQLNGLKLSRISFPLTIGGLVVQPGEALSDNNKLDELVKALVNETKERFRGELRTVDEVEKLKEVLASGSR